MGGCQNSGVYKGFDFSQMGEFRAWNMVAEHLIAVLARDVISRLREGLSGMRDGQGKCLQARFQVVA